MDIDLNGLLVFKHLARTGNFTETGRRWNLSQPAVSLIISKLETATGLVLFQRGPQGAVLTSAGQHFLDHAEAVCGAYLDFVDEIRSLGRREDREVLVQIDASWFGCLLRKAIGDSMSDGLEHGRCLLSPLDADWAESLTSDRCDVVVTGRFLRAGLAPGIQEAVIRRERGITVAWNPDFYPFDAASFNFPEVLSTTVLMPDASVVTGFSSFITYWCEYAYRLKPANALQFSSEEEAAEAAASGLGVFLGPGDSLPRVDGQHTRLKHVRTFEFLLPEGFTYGIYCRIDEDSKDILGTATAIGKLAKKLFAPGPALA